MQSILSRPKRLVLELSRNCNLNCIMCGFGGHPIQSEWFILEKHLDEILHPTSELQAFLGDIEEIRLNGRGESTLHPKFIEILDQLAVQFPKARFSMFTNLMITDEAILTSFIKHHVEIYVSMDSADPGRFETIRHGAKFPLLTKRLKLLPNIFLVFTLQKENIHEIEAIGRFAVEFHAGLIINIIRCDDPQYQTEFNGLLDRHWDAILKQFGTLHQLYVIGSKQLALSGQVRLLIPDQIWNRPVPQELATTVSCGSLPSCPNLREELMIAYDGTVYPCNMFNPKILGNLATHTLDSIWNSAPHTEFLSHHKQHYYCQHCEYMIPRRI